MPTEEQYKQALLKADAAGDTEAAELFASKIKELRASAAPSQPTSSVDSVPQAGLVQDSARMGHSPMGSSEVTRRESDPRPSNARIDFVMNDAMGEPGRNLPEIGDIDPERIPAMKKLGFGGMLKLAAQSVFTFDPQERARMFAQSIEGSKIDTLPDGTVVVTMLDDQGNPVPAAINRPGFSNQDIRSFFAEGVKAAPTARAATAGSTIAQKAIAGSLAAAANQSAQETVQTAMGGEYNPEDVAFAGGSGALFGAAQGFAEGLPATSRSAMRKASADIGAQDETAKDVIESLNESRELTDRTGIEFNRAQRTGSPDEANKLLFARKSEGGANIVKKQDLEQNRQIRQFRKTLQSEIADSGAMERSGSRVRDAANKSLENLEKQRAGVSSELYSKAYEIARKEGVEVDAKPLGEMISSLQRAFPKGNKLNGYLSRMRSMLGGDDIGSVDIEAFHNARMQLDDWIRFDAEVNGFNARQTQALKDIRAKMNGQIEQTGAVGSLFRRGDAAFADASRPIEEFSKSILGRIARKDDATLRKIVSDLFNPEETNPQVLIQAKREIEAVDKDAWRDIYRTQIERKLAKGKDLSEDVPNNLPAAWYSKLFGNETEVDMLLRSAPDAKTRQNVIDFKNALERAQIGRRGTSDTQPLGAIEKAVRRQGVAGFIQKFMAPKSAIIEGLGDMDYNAKTRAIAIALTDTRWQPEWDAIRKLAPDSQQAEDATAALFARVVRSMETAAVQSNRSSGDESE